MSTIISPDDRGGGDWAEEDADGNGMVFERRIISCFNIIALFFDGLVSSIHGQRMKVRRIQ